MKLSISGWFLTALALGSATLTAPEAAASVARLQGQSFPEALLALGSLIQLAISSLILLTVAVSGVGGTSSFMVSITPGLLRRALFVGAAGALAITPAGAEQLAGPQGHPQHSVTGLRLPDRPLAPAPRPADASHPGAVVVQGGDTLWAIAARSLPAGSSVRSIAEECARWHAVNRSTIGDDPDRIHPLQRLIPPTSKDRS